MKAFFTLLLFLTGTAAEALANRPASFVPLQSALRWKFPASSASATTLSVYGQARCFLCSDIGLSSGLKKKGGTLQGAMQFLCLPVLHLPALFIWGCCHTPRKLSAFYILIHFFYQH